MALAFEDLQWADPTSIDVLRALGEQGAHAPILIVATTRPEFRPPWTMRSHHSVLSLAPLDHAEVGRMIAELASRHALSRETVKGVSERTAGVPLFVEEVTRLLLESGEQGGEQTIPPTLQQSLAARLDRLGEAREIAQIGAVLGRGFSYALLRDIAELARLAHEHKSFWEAFAKFVEIVSDARNHVSDEGLKRVHDAFELTRVHNISAYDGLFKVAQAKAEARAGHRDLAITRSWVGEFRPDGSSHI